MTRVLKFNRLNLYSASRENYFPYIWRAVPAGKIICMRNMRYSGSYMDEHDSITPLSQTYLCHFIWYITEVKVEGNLVRVYLTVIGMPDIKSILQGRLEETEDQSYTSIMELLQHSKDILYITEVNNTLQISQVKKTNRLRIQKLGQLWDILQSLKQPRTESSGGLPKIE